MNYPRQYNAVADFVDAHVREGRAGKTAFIDPRDQITYGELCADTHRVANLLAAHGVEMEDRIVLLAHDSVRWPAVFWGAMRAGVVPVALNTLLGAEQYRYILADTRAKALFVSAPLCELVQPILPELPHLKRVFVVDGDPGRHIDYAEALAAQPQQAETADTTCDDAAFWLYSSGSTGMPKGVPHVHTSLMETARLFGHGILRIEERDVVFSAAKLFFAYGLGNAMTFPMSVGATTVLWPGRPTPEAVFAILKEHQPSVFYGVPTLYAAMLSHPDCSRDNSSARLRHCVSAGEALPAEVGRRWRSVFDVDIIDGVGSTELLHIFLSNRPGDIRYGSSGKAVPGYELRLVDEHGGEVAAGEIGELLVRAPSAAGGYWNQLGKSRATFQGEWTRTGDKYTRDPDGYYHYCGRTDDLFKVSGIWVSPFEVESALVSHPAVLEAAVVGYEDQHGLTKPKAFVVREEGAAGRVDDDSLGEELKAWVKD
ncbi:MAG: benzoate-CoA ligase family protein, partial [Gammaproteobacteria bacterium]|nr:benzoate-CoA ligase family protein [Gammaproteobacteria bacterium]